MGLILFCPKPVVEPGDKLHVMVGGRTTEEIPMSMLSNPGGLYQTACGLSLRHGLSLPDDPGRVSHEKVCKNCLRAVAKVVPNPEESKP